MMLSGASFAVETCTRVLVCCERSYGAKLHSMVL
ncbi:hypothetical protein MESS2_980016 [Mesorhizobium metallidurans STM 2683]|uniref:Uncharacterized protein n=1 Tax=Mesorhizobium metallidurans STM 2683 TaxID=1297569 RepID=M5EWB0_9HYPH|nr:hypothetical protein MESS2_980016 [Mesorhizobium metallidurans STM 2683]